MILIYLGVIVEASRRASALPVDRQEKADDSVCLLQVAAQARRANRSNDVVQKVDNLLAKRQPVALDGDVAAGEMQAPEEDASEEDVAAPAEEDMSEVADVEEDAAESPPRRELPMCILSNQTEHCLPNYMVIGVQKSGTSSLWKFMGEHKQIETAESKEMFFFNGMYGHENITCDPPDEKPNETDFAWYLDRFPQLNPESNAVVGEFTATYLQCWCCPQAFRRLLPNVRLIAQLRDPIDRAKSRWQEQHDEFQLIPTYGSFDEFIDIELPPLSDCLESAGEDLTGQVKCAAESNILGLSLYDASIQLWLQHFPREDILITYLEQFSSAPLSVMRAIEAHLGVADFQYGDELHDIYNPAGNYGWDNVTAVKASAQGNRSLQEERLWQFYLPHVIALQSMADAGQISKLPKSWLSRWHLESSPPPPPTPELVDAPAASIPDSPLVALGGDEKIASPFAD